jgi:phage virion morphogenesis protein
MSGGLIQIQVDERPVVELLGRLLASGQDMSTPFRQIAGVMAYAVEENFAQEGRPRWLQSDRAKKDGGKTLQLTGRLAASITTSSDALSATIGTNTIYAAIHQFGGQAGRKRATTIPARPFLSLADDDVEEIIDILEQHLTAG